MSAPLATTVDLLAAARNPLQMDTDNIAPSPRAGDAVVLIGKQDLDPFSVAELDARIAALEAEIVRVRAHMDRAVNHRAIADTLFKQ